MSDEPGARRSNRRPFFALVCALLGVLVLLSQPLLLSAQQHDERAVRAAFVYNLAKYVEWPSGGNEFVVGFFGEDELGELLRQTLLGKTIGAKSIRVVLNPSDAELESCDLVYLSQSAPNKFSPVLEKLRKRSTLTVGQNDSFARHGGMVGLVRSGDHIQIQVNLEAAQRAGLKIDSRLLNLAVIVHTTGAGD